MRKDKDELISKLCTLDLRGRHNLSIDVITSMISEREISEMIITLFWGGRRGRCHNLLRMIHFDLCHKNSKFEPL